MYYCLVLIRNSSEWRRKQICQIMLLILYFFTVCLWIKNLLRFFSLLRLVSWINVSTTILIICEMTISTSFFLFGSWLLIIYTLQIHLTSEYISSYFFSFLNKTSFSVLHFRRWVISKSWKSSKRWILTFLYIFLFLMNLYFLQFGWKATVFYFRIDTIAF